MAQPRPGLNHRHCTLRCSQHPPGTHAGSGGTWEPPDSSMGSGGSWGPRGKGTCPNAGIPARLPSVSRCWGQQEVDGSRLGTSWWSLLQVAVPTRGHEQVAPSCPSPSPREKSWSWPAPSASGKPNPAPGEETEQRLLCTSKGRKKKKEKKKSYLNKTALSLFWALSLRLESFLFPARAGSSAPPPAPQHAGHGRSGAPAWSRSEGGGAQPRARPGAAEGLGALPVARLPLLQEAVGSHRSEQ